MKKFLLMIACIIVFNTCATAQDDRPVSKKGLQSNSNNQSILSFPLFVFYIIPYESKIVYKIVFPASIFNSPVL